MRKILVTVAAAALLAAGFATWIKSIGSATSSVDPKTISTEKLHLETDVKKLPVMVIEDIN